MKLKEAIGILDDVRKCKNKSDKFKTLNIYSKENLIDLILTLLGDEED